MRSLRRTAMLWMTALIAAVGLTGAVIAYVLALREANSFMDGQLRQIALNAGPGLQGQAPALRRHDPEDDFVVQIWNLQGVQVHASPPDTTLPRPAAPGFRTIDALGQRWRVYSSSDASQLIQVAQQVEVRRELAESAALQAAAPILVTIPAGWLVISWAMGRILSDLRRLAEKVEALPTESREPIDVAQVPVEVAPLVSAMNTLIERLRRTLAQQRKFLSDAAHELRTPLTALNLQIANLDTGSGSIAAGGLQELERGSRRASALVDQLLRMARYEASTHVAERLDLDLAAVLLDAVADHVPLAESRGVDLGVLSSNSVPFVGDPRDLRILFGNLVDNAVKYSPEGSVVDVSIIGSADHFRVLITDSGPGIDPAILPRMFDRFARAAPVGIEGSGLGLAICKAIADRNGLRLMIANRDDRSGIRASVDGRNTH